MTNEYTTIKVIRKYGISLTTGNTQTMFIPNDFITIEEVKEGEKI